MTSSVNQSIQTFNLALDEIQREERIAAPETLAARIQEIATRCFEVKNTQGAVLDTDFTLRESFTRLEQRVNGLFLDYLRLGHVNDELFGKVFVSASCGDGTTLRMLLDTGRHVSVEIFEEAFVSAAYGNGTTLRILLDTGRQVSVELFGKAFVSASCGDGTTLRILLDTGRLERISDGIFGEAFLWAVRGNGTTLRMLMDTERQVSVEIFEEVFRSAVIGNGTILRILLDTGRHVSDEIFAVAFIEAASLDGITLGMLLNTVRQVSKGIFEVAFGSAAYGNGTTLRMLLDTGRQVSDGIFGKAFVSAASGDGTTLRILLDTGRQFTDEIFGEALKLAAQRNGTTLRMLLDTGRLERISDGIFEVAFVSAAYLDGTTLRMLMDTERQVSVEIFGEALKLAARGNGTTLRMLMDTGRQVRDEFFGEAFVSAASGDGTTLRILLDTGRQFTDEIFGAAFVSAARRDGTTLRMLLDTGRLERISDGIFREAFVSAAYLDGTTLRMLMDTERQVSVEIFEEVFRSAVIGNGKILRILLDTGRQVRDEFFGEAFRSAARANGITLRMLLNTGRLERISDEFFGEAFVSAARGDGTILQMLIDTRRQVRDEFFGEAFRSAARANGITLRMLLNTGRQFTDEIFELAFIEASRDDGTTLRILLDTGRHVSVRTYRHSLSMSIDCSSENAFSHLILSAQQITDIDTRNDATIFASSRGRLDLVEAILRQGAIGPLSRDSAITQASGEQREAIRDMLRMARIEEPEAADAMLARSQAYMVSLRALKESPLECLGEFCSLDALPSSFSLEQTPQVVDLGGVSKQVYFELMSSLIDKKVLPVRESGLICSIEGMPLATAHLLGRFFSLLDDRNIGRSDKFLTGHVFSTAFYQLAQNLLVSTSSDEDKQREAAALLRTIETNLAPCFAWIESPSESSKQGIVKVMEDMYEDGEPEDYARSTLNAFLAPIEAFLSGASDSFKDKIKATDPNELRRQIQGEAVTAEMLCSALRMEGVTPLLTQQLGWIQEKIAASDESWQKAFLYAITGRNTMMPNTEIKIKLSWRNVFEIHTCFNTLDLPTTEMNKEDFLAALDAAILDQSYNIA